MHIIFYIHYHLSNEFLALFKSNTYPHATTNSFQFVNIINVSTGPGAPIGPAVGGQPGLGLGVVTAPVLGFPGQVGTAAPTLQGIPLGGGTCLTCIVFSPRHRCQLIGMLLTSKKVDVFRGVKANIEHVKWLFEKL